jgi:hypothetical protein
MKYEQEEPVWVSSFTNISRCAGYISDDAEITGSIINRWMPFTQGCYITGSMITIWWVFFVSYQEAYVYIYI